jgi:hypothetical protein
MCDIVRVHDFTFLFLQTVIIAINYSMCDVNINCNKVYFSLTERKNAPSLSLSIRYFFLSIVQFQVETKYIILKSKVCYLHYSQK